MEHAIHLRARYAICLGFVFMGRQDTCIRLATLDHGIDSHFIWLRLTEKMKRGWRLRRVVRLPLEVPPSAGHASALPMLARLGRAYVDTRDTLLGGQSLPRLFQLPGEPPPTTRHMEGWVASVLRSEGIRAPPGFAYLGHSLRSGGSSAAEAIGVPRFRGNWLGGWSQHSTTREVHYLDPSILPTPAAHALFGWLLAGAYTCDHPHWERSPHTRDRVDVGEAT